MKTGNVVERHGEVKNGRRSPEYLAYHNAKRRCDQRSPQKANYAERGIRFCFASFAEFLAEVGRRPTPRHSIDRIDNDGNYEPGNVRWATYQQQSRNTRHLITALGETRCQRDWEIVTGLPVPTRLSRGWCVECAVSIPPVKGINGKNGITCEHRRAK